VGWEVERRRETETETERQREKLPSLGSALRSQGGEEELDLAALVGDERKDVRCTGGGDLKFD
jgi:hypothetical protein